MNARPLRVCIDARATPEAGGVRQALIGLAAGLAELGGNDEYRFLVFDSEQEWLRPYVPDARNIIPQPEPRVSLGRRLLRGAAGRSGALRRLAARSSGSVKVAVPELDEAVARTGADCVHLAMPFGFRTRLPTVYTVYDLQHLHFPEYFHPATDLRRETAYRALCEQAAAVTTLSHWGRLDLLEHYDVEPERVFAAGLASVLSLYPTPDDETIAAVHDRFDLPPQFAFFPANTWPHKNHLTLLEALATLRGRGLDIPLVCSGVKTDFFVTIHARVRELGLADSVRFLDYVGPTEIHALYRLCRCVVFPTKFEGWGMPLTEALAAGRPAACSAIPPLLEQTKDAAVMFDPDDPIAIAEAIEQVWTDDTLRRELIQKGAAEAASMSWTKTALLYRALYRRVAGRPLTGEDTGALAEAQSLSLA
jgi:glycosyltransferase involved in cell wall biosynthesis